VSTGAKEDESSTGRVWAAGFHIVAARYRLAGVFKLTNRLFIEFSNMLGGRGETLILNQRIQHNAEYSYTFQSR
jgi:hypothetical protein